MKPPQSSSGRSKVAIIATWLLVILVACKQTPQATESVGPVAPATNLPPSSATETVTITFAADKYSLPAYEALAEEFNATHSVQVSVQDLNKVKGNWQEFAPTPEMLNELASNVDIFTLPESSLPVGLESGAFLDLSPLAESDPNFAPDDFFPGLLAHFEHQGRLWGLPASVGGVFIFYNKTLFDRAGVDYPTPGWTWDHFLSAAEHLTSEGESAKQFGFFDAWGGQGVISFIQQYGGDLLDRTALTPTLDDPLVAEAVRWYVDLTLKHGVSPRRSDTTAMSPMEFIHEHQVAMWTDGLFNWSFWSKELQGQVGVAPFPEDQAAVNPVMLGGYFVSSGTAHPQACWQWISFLTQQHVAGESAEQLPPRRSVFETSEYFARMGAEAKVAMRYALEHPAPPMMAYDHIVISALFKSLDAVWQGEATVEEALAQAQARAEEGIAQAVAQAAAAPTPPPVRPVPSPTPDAAPVSLAFLIDDALDAAPYQALADQFSQGYPDVSVTVRDGSLSSFGETAGSADCFLWPTFARPDDWQQHVIPLGPFLQDARDFALDDFYLQGIADLSDGGELWGMPLFVVPDLIYFNKDLFDADGVPYPAPGWRWDDFLAAAQALTGDEGDTKQYGFVPWANAAPEALAFISQHGASPVDDLDDPTRPTFNAPRVVEALAWYADLARVHQVMPPLWENDDPYTAGSERNALIRSGRVAMWTDNPWLGNPYYDFAFGAVPPPGDRRPATDFDSWAAYISAYSPHPAQCWEWLRYLSDHLATGPGIPARCSLAEGSALTQEQAASSASLNHENTRLNRWRDRTRWTGWVYPWFKEAVRDILSGRAPASQALEQTQSRAEAFLLCLASPGDVLSQEEALVCALEVDPAYPVPSSENP